MAPVDEFSALRARRHIEEIARAPRPIGSAENSRVRDYIVHELEFLGIPVSVESMTAVRRDSAIRYSGGFVRNVVARLPGTASTKAVLLVCHYDSVVEGPGASDDANGIAVLLETAHALVHRPRLRNDVVFLFTDGEEPVMLGADAAVTQSAWMQDIGLVLNFEARGTGGPALMFEASSPDGALVGEFAHVAPYPKAASFFRDVYERMPLGTDFSLFKKRGIAGLNFAYIGGGGFYHTSEDNLARLDLRSLQHQGACALALARHFGGMPLPLAPAPNAAYFNAGNVLVHFPMSWMPWIEAALTALFLMVVWTLRQRGRLRLRSVAFGFGFILVVCVVSCLFGLGWLKCFKVIHPGWNDLPFGQVYGRGWLTAAMAMPVVVLVSCFTTYARERLGQGAMGAALAAIGLALSALVSWMIPGAAPVVLALALSGLLLLGLVGCSPGANPVWWIAALLTIVPVLVVWIPLVGYLDAGLGIHIWPLVAVVAALAAVLVAVAALAVERIERSRGAAAAGVVMAVLAGIGLWAGRYSERQPRPDNIFYALDADADAGFWATRQARLGPWSSAILGPQASREKFRTISTWLGGEEVFWRAPAARFPLALPELEVLHSECANDLRTFDLKVRSPRGAHALLVQFQSERDTEIFSLNGVTPHELEKPALRQQISRYIDLRGLPAEGMTIRVRIHGCGKLLVRLVERSADLSPVFPKGVPPLPPAVMTAWEDDYYNRCVLITRRITVE